MPVMDLSSLPALYTKWAPGGDTLLSQDPYSANDWVGVRVFATMLYPHDKKRREDFLLWGLVNEVHLRQKAGWGDAEIIKTTRLDVEFAKSGGLKRLLDAPSYKDIMAHAAEVYKKGRYAGEIVTGILRFSKDSKAPRLGVNKATDLISLILKNPPKGYEKRSTRVIWNYWKDFKEVAHLWAAHCLLYKFQSKKLYLKENALKLLSMSEKIRRFGESYRWHENRPPLFDVGKSWVPPKNFPLPDIELKTKRVTDRLLALLEQC